MNKLIYRLSACAILAGCISTANAATSLSLSEASIAPGGIGYVSVTLNNDEACRGLSSRIELPDGLTVTGIKPIEAGSECMVNVNTTPGKEQFYLLPAGKVLEPGAGTLCQLTIAASNSFKGGSIILSEPEMVDESYSDMKLSDCRGYVSGIVSFSMSIPDLMILPGETKRIEICLENQGYVGGCQADLTLPEGLTLDTSSVSTTERTVGMTAMASHNEDGHYRLMVFSAIGASISGTIGPVLYANITADSDIKGRHSIPVSNVSISDLKGRSYRGADSSTNVTITEEQSEIAIDFSGMGIQAGEDLWLKVGDSRQVKVAVSNFDGALIWQSTNADVASVTASGEVKAIGPGSAVITISPADGRDIKTSLVVNSYLPGDSNADKWVDVADVVNINNYIVGNDVETFIFPAADINEDKDIDVTDAVKTAYIALEADLTLSKMRRRVSTYASADLSDYVNVNIKGNRIGLALGNGRYSALQFDMKLPAGITVADAQLGEAASSSHRLITKSKDDGTLRVMVFALDNAEFAIDQQNIVEISLSSIANTNGIEISNFIAADTNAHSHLLEAKINDDILTGIDNVSSEVRIYPEASGIEITGAIGETANVYTLDGKILISSVMLSDCEHISLEKGIYVVIVNNVVKKIHVK
ncbi:MAG: hypothetical protein K2M31_07380 [Muribaculaceae bacterium]|nr:hypothetical protein [Muribaculaceae bacterium]